MACQTAANAAAKSAEPSGVAPGASKATYIRPQATFWRGYGGRIKAALKTWRSAGDDVALLKARSEAAVALAVRAESTGRTDHPAGRARDLADARVRLLNLTRSTSGSKALTVGERVERLAILDNAIALLRQRGRISEAQYRAALLTLPCAEAARPPRSKAPARWLPARPVGAEIETASQVDPGRKIRARYRLVDLADPIASNTPGGAANPAYDQRLQPRRRERAASRQQIDRMAARLNPAALLRPEAAWDDGPPLVNQAGMVESGNGRLLALRRATGTNAAAYAAYREALVAQAARFGFDRAEVEGMAQPVLVRERLTELDEAAQLRFIAEANSSRAARTGPAEQSRADAGRIPPGFFADLRLAEADSSLADVLGKRANAPVVARFFKLLPLTEQAALRDSQGGLSADGMQRLERALFAYALPGPSGERLARLIYEEAEAIDRVGAGLKAALPGLGQLEDRIRSGRLDPELRLGEDLAAAVEKLRDLRQAGLAVNDYLRQHKILPELSAFQEQLLAQLDARRRSARAIAGLLNAYTGLALSAPPPNQGQLFSGPAVTPTGLFRSALKQVGGQWVDLAAWSAAQQTMAGFDIPAADIQPLEPDQQRIGMLIAANTPIRNS